MKHKNLVLTAVLGAMLGASGLAQARGLLDILALPLLAPLYIATHAPIVVPAVSVALAPRVRVAVAPACAPAPVVYTLTAYHPLVYRRIRRPMYVRMPAYRPGWRYGRHGWERDRG